MRKVQSLWCSMPCSWYSTKNHVRCSKRLQKLNLYYPSFVKKYSLLGNDFSYIAGIIFQEDIIAADCFCSLIDDKCDYELSNSTIPNPYPPNGLADYHLCEVVRSWEQIIDKELSELCRSNKRVYTVSWTRKDYEKILRNFAYRVLSTFITYPGQEWKEYSQRDYPNLPEPLFDFAKELKKHQ